MIKKIFKTAYYSFFAVIAAIIVFLIFSVFPMRSGYGAFIVLSGSMEPKIHTGSIVTIKAQKEYDMGDVITFRENAKKKKPTTHRIVEINRNEITGDIAYITKGDANNNPDQKPVKKEEIFGKVILSIPFAGYAVAATQKPAGFMLIIVIPAVIVIYDEIQKIKKEIALKIDYRKRIKKRKENNINNTDEKKEEKI